MAVQGVHQGDAVLPDVVVAAIGETTHGEQQADQVGQKAMHADIRYQFLSDCQSAGSAHGCYSRITLPP